jgi:hypothetical protein
MNTVGRMQKLTAMGAYIQHLGDTTVEMDVTAVDDTTVDWHITVQHPGRDGLIEALTDSARERSYPLTAVARSLSNAGFRVIDRFDSFGHPATDDSDRVYWVCRQS